MSGKTGQTHSFYADLKPIDSFFEITDPECFRQIPEDWFLGITDIVNSSNASDTEGYKWVNILGAAPIVALMNETARTPLPYTFSGDGCAFFVPPEFRQTAEKVLTASRNRGRTAFDLELRIALIPVRALYEEGVRCNVARVRSKGQFDQAVFSGGGLSHAESILKNSGDVRFNIREDTATDADFSGLECRWEEVNQPGQRVFTYLIEAVSGNKQDVYAQVLSEMRQIFGFDDHTNPLYESGLKMNLSSQVLSGEIRFRSRGQGWWKWLLYNLEIRIRIVFGFILMKFGIKTRTTDWSLYKKDVVLNSDHRKFDDMLRMVITASDEQADRFRKELQQAQEAGKLTFGEHASDGALITCMVFDWHRQHIHFVDGSGGGYVRASKDLKRNRTR